MNRMKQLRERMNKTKAQVARELNMPYTTYVNYEKEAREPNSENLIQIANYFNVSVDYLIGRSNDEETVRSTNADQELQEYLEELKNRPEMRMLFSVSKNATKEDVEQAVKIIEALKKD